MHLTSHSDIAPAIHHTMHVLYLLPRGYKLTLQKIVKNDFFTKNRVRNTLPGRKSVFDQTFVKSLRVRNALQWGLTIYFFVDGDAIPCRGTGRHSVYTMKKEER